jgi:hypothetical protein
MKTLLVALALVCLTNGILTTTSSTPKPTVGSMIIACTTHGC